LALGTSLAVWHNGKLVVVSGTRRLFGFTLSPVSGFAQTVGKRWTLFALRTLAVTATLVMLTQLVLVQQRVGLPELWIVIDDSASMSTDDLSEENKSETPPPGTSQRNRRVWRLDMNKPKRSCWSMMPQRWRQWNKQYRVEVFFALGAAPPPVCGNGYRARKGKDNHV
jgi:hypothetical protein